MACALIDVVKTHLMSKSMLRSRCLRIGVQGSGFWSPRSRQKRSLGEKGSHMRAVSQERFQSRHAKFKVQQAVNLEHRDRHGELIRLQRECRGTAEEVMHRKVAGDVASNQSRMAAARDMLQLGEALRKERRRSIGGSFIRSEMRARRGEFRR
jgi:hypothetical protein